MAETVMCCPFCGSENINYSGSKTVGARDPKIKHETSINLNPLKPFTLVNTKEKVVKQGSDGFTYDMYRCMSCGKQVRGNQLARKVAGMSQEEFRSAQMTQTKNQMKTGCLFMIAVIVIMALLIAFT